MYRFGEIPSQFDPLSSNFSNLRLSLPSHQRVENDIRSTYDQIMERRSQFGHSHFGYTGDDSDSDSDSDATYDDFDNEPGPPGFGKKQSAAVRANQKNAARAMRLSRREDISLKEAWAIVKGKKSSKKRKTTRKRKTTKRKKNSDASRAMKLAHREGITLKQAWKRVKRS